MATTYLTAAQLRAGTQNTFIQDESDDNVLNALIERAERYVDAVAGYWQKYDPDQTRIFPRRQDIDSAGDTYIHEMVKEATLIQAEFLFLQTPDDEDGIKEDDAGKKGQIVSPRMKKLMRGSGLTRRVGILTYSNLRYNPNRL